MSYAIDVNLLLYASDTSSEHHPPARAFLDECARADEVVCFGWPTLMSYLRIATHPAIFDAPLSPRDAEANVDALLSLPHARAIGDEDGFWRAYRELTRGLAARGNLVPDAHLAAILKIHDVRTLYTNDADFRKFPFLEVRNPLPPDTASR